MVFSTKEIYSFHTENVASLFKYDVTSCVGRDMWTRENIGRMYVTSIDVLHPVEICINFNDLHRLKYAVDIDIETLKEKFILQSKLTFYNDLNEINWCLSQFIQCYREWHLKHRTDALLMIEGLLSLCQILNLSGVHRNRIFIFAIKTLFKAKVEDCCVWEKLVLFLKNRSVSLATMARLEVEEFQYFLRRICKKNNSKGVLDAIFIHFVLENYPVDMLKSVLHHKSCIEYNSSDVDRFLQQFFCSLPSRDAEFFPMEYSKERIVLLVQMAYTMKMEDCWEREFRLKAIKLYWKTVPQAFITREEMRGILDRLYNSILSELSQTTRQSIEDGIHRACEEYQKTFDVCELKPRTLKNYSMIVVRKSYVTAEAIEKLTYPEPLKAYINLK